MTYKKVQVQVSGMTCMTRGKLSIGGGPVTPYTMHTGQGTRYRSRLSIKVRGTHCALLSSGQGRGGGY